VQLLIEKYFSEEVRMKANSNLTVTEKSDNYAKRI